MCIKGLVIEAGGRAHVPKNSLNCLIKAIENGTKIVLTTSCEEGQVFPVYDFLGGAADLKSKGVILGKDYDSKKARIKLAVLLAAGVNDIKAKFKY